MAAYRYSSGSDHCKKQARLPSARRIAFMPFWLLHLVVAICLGRFIGADIVIAEPSSTPPAVGQVAAKPFDIPSQPLEDALYAFDSATGIEVFVDGTNVAGRRSASIKGIFMPVDALRAILSGTGLEAKLLGPNAITLAPGKSQNSASSLTYRSYSALVQTAVLRTLCAEPAIRPGGYRIAAQLWLAPTGVVSAANLLSSTGDAMRDRRLHEVLIGISTGMAPPPALPQPIILVILARSPQDSGDCG